MIFRVLLLHIRIRPGFERILDESRGSKEKVHLALVIGHSKS